MDQSATHALLVKVESFDEAMEMSSLVRLARLTPKQAERVLYWGEVISRTRSGEYLREFS